jgi:hypothetical protein
MAVFWVVAPCSLVEVYQRFRGPCCLHHQGDRSSALQPRRQPSSHSPPWKPQILLRVNKFLPLLSDIMLHYKGIQIQHVAVHQLSNTGLEGRTL